MSDHDEEIKINADHDASFYDLVDEYEEEDDQDEDEKEDQSFDEKNKILPPPYNFPSVQSDKFFRHNTLPFYDRENELDILQKACDRVSLEGMENQSEIVWVRGHVGVGKSSLVNEATKRIFKNDQNVVCRSSCEQHNTASKPMSALANCLNDLCDKLQEKGGKAVWNVRLDEALGGEGPLLATIVPKIKTLMDVEAIDTRRLLAFDVNSRRRLDRLAFAMRDFLRSVSEIHPLIMIFDNIHWADLDSLRILQDLVTTKTFENTLLVGCYEKGDAQHPFETLRKLLKKSEIPTTRIKLKSFSIDEVEEILKRAFLDSGLVDDQESIDKVRELAKYLYAFTRGNPLYIMQSIRLLNDKGLLAFEKSEEQWNWNKESVKDEIKLWKRTGDKAIQSIEGIVKTRINKISRNIRFVVEALACLRLTVFNSNNMKNVIELAWARKDKPCPIKSEDDLESALHQLCALGILSEIGEKWFKFTHDIIREYAFLYAVENRKEPEMLIHLEMGKQLTKMGAESKVESDSHTFKFLAVDQLNLCASFINGDDRIKLCKFNQEVAEISISKTSFRKATIYLELGTNLLHSSDRWIPENYDTTLRSLLYLARMKVCCGQLDVSKAICHDIFKNTTHLKDKVLASHLMFDIMIEEGSYDEASTRVLALLSRMGEQFPEPDFHKVPSIVEREVNIIRNVVIGKSNQELLRPQKMSDRKSLDLMLLLATLAEISEKRGDTHYITFATIRMMHLSLKFGFSRQYPLAFAYFGIVLMKRSLVKEAFRFGQVAEKTSRPGDYYGGKSIILFHWNISHWRRNYRRSLEPVLNVYNWQVDTGDFHNVAFSINTYIQYHLVSGYGLERLADNLDLFNGLFVDYGLPKRWRVSTAIEFVANMLDDTESPLVFFGDTLDQQNSKLAEMEESDQQDAIECVHLMTLFRAFFFHDMETAEDCLTKLETPQGVWIPWFYFLQAIVLISYLPDSKGKERKDLKEQIEEKKGQLIEWYNEGAPNPNAMVSILEVEYMVAKEGGKTATMKAQQLYDDAVHAAVKDGVIHLQAYVCERAGMYFDAIGVDDISGKYLRRAHKMYDNWNALAKVIDIENRFADKLQVPGRQKTVAGNAYIRQNELLSPGQGEIGGGRSKVIPINIIKLGKQGRKGLKTGARKVKSLFTKAEDEEFSKQEYHYDDDDDDEMMNAPVSFRLGGKMDKKKNDEPSKMRSSKLLTQLKSPVPRKNKLSR